MNSGADRGPVRALGASLAWVAVAVGFGGAIGNVLDPRAVIHAVNAAVLATMSARTMTGASSLPVAGARS